MPGTPLARLRAYREKRDFRRTPEPTPRSVPDRRRSGSTHGLYVVQRHAASHLHYDFRLEHRGVLLSWAVPKEPTRRRGVRRLAVRVEDHPLAYARFSGTIPKGQYGAGTVEIWDRGRWRPTTDDVDAALARGKLGFTLEGGRLAGAWHLVRLQAKPEERDGGRNWLLLADPGETEAPPDEAVAARPSGRRAAPSRASAARANPGASSAFELATLVDAPPEGDAWVHETKWDGYRMMAALEHGRRRPVALVSRSGADWAERLPEIVEAVDALDARSAVLDGEVVTLRRSRSDFSDLQYALGEAPGGPSRRTLRYVVFDLLALDGEDLRPLPLRERKRRLVTLLATRPRGSRLRASPHRRGPGRERLAEACRRGLEGIVSKRAEAPYRPGRGDDWRKTKCHSRQELAIVGFTGLRRNGSGSGSRTASARELGALLLAVHDGKDYVYAGKVGTGFDDAARVDLLARLERDERGRPPRGLGGTAVAGAHWVAPRLVAEVRFSEWTRDGRLRHPSFVALREDKRPEETRRERPRNPRSTGTRTKKREGAT